MSSRAEEWELCGIGPPRQDTSMVADTSTWVHAYIAFGSNLGDRQANIQHAIQSLADDPRIQLRMVSDTYETEPVGPIQQDWFYNLVAAFETDLSPRQLLMRTQEVEQALGRVRDVSWGPRSIDLDLLLVGDRCLDEPELILPHPRMHERRFVLEPLCQIAPEVIHPKLHQSIRVLLDSLDDEKVVRCLGAMDETGVHGDRE